MAAAAAGVLPGSAVDLEQGCLTVPVDAAPAEVYAFAAARAGGDGGAAGRAGARGRGGRGGCGGAGEPAAAAPGARRGRERRALPALLPQAGRANSPALLPLLEGLSVCVAERNGVWLERGMLLLAWDFEL